MRQAFGRCGLAAAGALALFLGAPAWADVWGFRDSRGVTHFADHAVDGRYVLLYSDGDRSSANATRRASPAGSPPRAQTRFAISHAYKAVSHLIREAASTHGLDAELLKAVIATESGFNARAVSPKGAVGLMQLMPDTARRFGVTPRKGQTLQERLTDPRTNILAGASYLAWLLKTFEGDTELALAAYNAGEGAVQRAGRRIPNYRETRDYVRKVTQLHQSLLPPPGLNPVGGGSLHRPSPSNTELQTLAAAL